MGLFDRAKRRGTAAEPLALDFFTRARCTLCDEMLEALARAGLEGRYVLARHDVDLDPALKRAYGLRVPVLAHEGLVLAEGRASPAALREAFEERVRALAGGR